MANSGYIRKTISLTVDLWNLIPEEELNDNFSRFVQDAIRLKLKNMKIQNIREFLDNLNDSELLVLRDEFDKMTIRFD